MNVHVDGATKDESPTGGHSLNLAERAIVISHIMLKWKDEIMGVMDEVGTPFTFDQLVEKALAGQIHVYPYTNSLLLCEVLEFGTFKSYHGFVAVGKLEDFIEAEPDLHRVAKELGCKEMTISGRPGWVRALKQNGWSPKTTLVMKEV